MTLPRFTRSARRLLVLIAPSLLIVGDGGLATQAQEGLGRLFSKRGADWDNPAAGYEVDRDWPRHSPERPWGEMPGVAIDAHDHIWTFNRGAVPVQVFEPSGTLVRAWGEKEFQRPHGIAHDPRGNVWLTDIGSHVVRQYTPEGRRLLELGTPGQPGEDETHFNQPTDVAIAPGGDIYVADGYVNNRIVHFDRQGRFLRAWGSKGSEPGQFRVPHALALDSRGRLYVADRGNARVQVFDPAGRFLAEWRHLMIPWDIWITADDQIYVCGSSPMRWGPTQYLRPLGIPPKDQLVMKFDPAGKALQLWTFPPGGEGDAPKQPGELSWVHGMAVDSRGDLYLGDIVGRRAEKFRRLEATLTKRPVPVNPKSNE